MKIKYQADNDLDRRIIDAAMRLAPESDFKTAPAAGFHAGTADPAVLRYAAEANRILVSHDLKPCRSISGNLSRRTPVRESSSSGRK